MAKEREKLRLFCMQDQLTAAMGAVQEDGVSVRKAFEVFKIPRTTFENHLASGNRTKIKTRKAVLTNDQANGKAKPLKITLPAREDSSSLSDSNCSVQDYDDFLNPNLDGKLETSVTISKLMKTPETQEKISVTPRRKALSYQAQKIQINGKHLCEFPHRIPYQQLKYVKIEGDVNVSSVTVESQPTAPTVMMNNLPPPPYSEPAPQPVGYYPPPLNSGPQMPMPMPMPMPMSMPNSTPNYSSVVPPPSQQQAYVSDPLIQQQARIAALNATPRPYQGRWNGFFRYGDRKVGIIGLVIYGVVAVIFIVVFLVVFFTMFNKSNSEHEAFRKKHFPDW
ncbi:hypothetical protein FQA39_LY03317 [Lamprigera yunnana]|nr:hypothetical protein FQA39_LY03317 [Lamprigera yunnana]